MTNGSLTGAQERIHYEVHKSCRLPSHKAEAGDCFCLAALRSVHVSHRLPAGLSKGRRVHSKQWSLKKGHYQAPIWRSWALIMITDCWLRAGVFQTQKHPAENPSITGGRGGSWNTWLRQPHCSILRMGTFLPVCFEFSLCSVPKKEYACEGSFGLVPKEGPLFFWKRNQKHPKKLTRTTTRFLHLV